MDITTQDIAAELLAIATRLRPLASTLPELDDDAYDACVVALAEDLGPELELLGMTIAIDDLHHALGLLWCGADRHVSTAT